jgi:hypothetical protein
MGNKINFILNKVDKAASGLILMMNLGHFKSEDLNELIYFCRQIRNYDSRIY